MTSNIQTNKVPLVSLFVLALCLAGVYTQNCPQGQLNIDNKCRPCSYIVGCASYTSASSCAICEYGYQLVNGRCQYLDKPLSECCALTDANGSCLQCAPGLYLDGNTCIKIQRPGCLQYKGTICTNCAQGYQNINGRCLTQIQNCINYSQSTYTCTQCAVNFQLTQNQCTLIVVNPTCPYCQFSNEYGCVQCQQGFYLSKNRTCVQFNTGCIKYFRENCQLCLNGYKLVNGQCLMDGCLTFNNVNGTGCAKCQSPYILTQQNKCILQNCLQSNNGSCLLCQNDYRIQNGKCIKYTQQKCTNINCPTGYFLSPQSNKCTKITVGCKTYSAEGLCTQCNQLFVISNNVCIVPGCDKVSDSGCAACLQPFVLSQGKCVIDGCQQHNYQNRCCRTCKNGSHVQQGVCVKNNPLCLGYSLVNGTQVCSSCINPQEYILSQQNVCVKRQPGCVYQYGKCITCASPFKKYTNNVCVIDGCALYSLTGCISCTAPYQLNLNSCTILYCEQIVNNTCTKCTNGYHLISNGQCQQDDPKCSSYNPNGICNKCVDGCRFNQQNNCIKDIPNCIQISNNQCIQCSNGYQLVSGSCILTDRNCIKFDSVSNKGCAQCQQGYHTESGICVINQPNCLQYTDYGYTQVCRTCANGYVFSSYQNNNKCIKAVAGCVYDNKGICSSCKAPFTYSNTSNNTKCIILGCSKYSQNGCYQCDPPFSISNSTKCQIQFCSQYDTNNKCCGKCQQGYRLQQGTCQRQDPRCVQYNQNGQCTQCYKDYAVVQNTCIKQDVNCITYSKQGGCNKCQQNYYVSVDGLCLPQQPGCIYQNNKCTLCNFPFKFDQNAQKCRIDGCLQSCSTGCTKCKYPYTLNNNVCEIANCVNVKDNHCVRCTPGYHVKQGLTCVKNDVNCLQYNDDGDCQLCGKGFLLMSSGECQVAEDNCLDKKKSGQCLACKDGYFVNTFFQCEKKDTNCIQYNNGVCTQCDRKYFLYSQICFPYSPGCVSYTGKDCNKCKSTYSLVNGQCFILKKPGLQLQGQNDKYDFDITPIDITKSKYYIDNLSPISKLGKVFYSSYAVNYSDCRLDSQQDDLESTGWKAQNNRAGEYIGYTIQNGEPVTFYAIQILAVNNAFVSQFYIEYSVDGTTYIRVEKEFSSAGCDKNLTTIYFTGLYAKSIRIIVKSFVNWPAAKIQFFYYDYLRFRKISNLKSLTYLKNAIDSNFVDRMDNQMYINQRAYFNPSKTCGNQDVCFSGLELCQQRTINTVSISCTPGTLKKVYLTYSLDGRNFNCFEQCTQVVLNDKQTSNQIILNKLLAKNVRVYPVQYTGTPSISITYDYS